MSSRATLFAAFLLAIAGLLYGVKLRNYPYGARPCQLPCTMMALKTFALDHEGQYPNVNDDPFLSLQALFPNYLDGNKLSGISGNMSDAVQRLLTNRTLDSNSCSWVYFPGFRTDDPINLMIIMEARGGIGFNGFRDSEGSHAVGFASGEFRQVSAADWERFLQEQARLRSETIARRDSKLEKAGVKP